MSAFQIVPAGRRLTSLAVVLAALAAACDSDTAGVAGETAIPADSTLATSDPMTPAAPADSATRGTTADSGATAPSDSSLGQPAGDSTTSGGPTSGDSTSSADSASSGAPAPDREGSAPVPESATSFAGIVFGTNSIDASLLGSVHTGTMRGGGVTENNVGSLLADVRAKGGRIVLKLCMGSDSYVKNSDGTFSLTKWKSLVARFKSANLGPYISDGTIVGHYLIDEPQRAVRWGGKAISPATLEAMAQYSKSIWPTMTTFVRALPSELAKSSTTYRYLDAGWAQYVSGKGNVNTYISTEVAAAKNKGLGLMVGLNVLDGGDGSSRIAGYTRGKYAMSATEIRTYGTALLNQSYVCGFFNWMYDAQYYGRSDVKSAFSDMSTKARGHVKTSCKQ